MLSFQSKVVTNSLLVTIYFQRLKRFYVLVLKKKKKAGPPYTCSQALLVLTENTMSGLHSGAIQSKAEASALVSSLTLINSFRYPLHKNACITVWLGDFFFFFCNKIAGEGSQWATGSDRQQFKPWEPMEQRRGHERERHRGEERAGGAQEEDEEEEEEDGEEEEKEEKEEVMLCGIHVMSGNLNSLAV